MRVLVIEDEVRTAKFLKKGLGEEGSVVDVAGDGLEGLCRAREVEFDLVILDVMLRGLDRWQVLSHLREAMGNSSDWTTPGLRASSKLSATMAKCSSGTSVRRRR